MTKPIKKIVEKPLKASASKPRKAVAAVAKILLPSRLQINNLDALHADMCKLLTAKEQHVVVDGGEITLVDSAGVQLLVAFFRSFIAGGGKVEWENYSVQLYQMADELGIAGQLGG